MAYVDPASACREQQQFILYKFNEMRASHFMTDITIVCKGEEFSAHRSVLCATSPFFRGMFGSQFKETVSGKVTFATISAEAAKALLDFMYVGQMPSTTQTNEKLLDILHASHFLQLNILFQFCLHRIIENITERRFLKILQITELYDEGRYLDEVLKYLAVNFFQITNSQDFFNLDISHIKLLLQHPILQRYPADLLLESVISWVKFEPKKRVMELGELLSCLNLEKLSLGMLNSLLQDYRVKQNEAIYNRLLSASFDKVADFCFEAHLLCFVSNTNLRSTLLSYDIKREKWTERLSLPLNLDLNCAVTFYNKCVYFIGGDQYVTNVFKYSLVTGEVAELDHVRHPVCDAGAAGYRDHVYVVGGSRMDSPNTAVKNVHRIDCNTGTNEPLCPCRDPHISPTMFTFQDNLYVIGSQDNTESSLEKYDLLNDQWTEITRIPDDINWCKACVCDEMLIVVPNEERDYSGDLLFYDLLNNTWETKTTAGGPEYTIWDLLSVYYKHEDKTLVFAMGDRNSLFVYDYFKNAFKKVVPKSKRLLPWEFMQRACVAYGQNLRILPSNGV